MFKIDRIYITALNYIICILLCSLVSQQTFALEEDEDLLNQEAALLAEIKQQLASPAANNTETSQNNSKITNTQQAENKQNNSVASEKKTSENKNQLPAQSATQQNTQKQTAKVHPVVNTVKSNPSANTAATDKKVAQTKNVSAVKSNVDKKQATTTQAPSIAGLKVEDLLDENATLKSTLMAKEAQLAALQAKIEKQRNEIIMAESELQRVATLVDQKRSESLKQMTGLQYKQQPATAETKKPEAQTFPRTDVRRVAETPEQTEKMSADMSIATVIIDKANLRTGPGTNNSPLMAVSKGTRLAVETRHEDWYRVIAPTGMRAWISADMVAFGKDRFSDPNRILQVKGHSSAEENAIKLIRRSLR